MNISTSRLLAWALLVGACSSAPSTEQSAGVAGHMFAAGSGAGGPEAGQGGTPAGAAGAAAAGGAGAAAGGAGPVAMAEILRSGVAADASPDVSDTDYAAFKDRLATFGLDLGQKLVETKELGTENLVYSPLSAAYALAMAYAGARTDTAVEMKAVLGDSFSGTTYHSAANRMARELASRVMSEASRTGGRATKIELSVVDALFVERTLEVQPSFLDLLAREYDSGVQRLDFRNAHDAARMTINDWVAEQTHDKILDLLPDGAVDARTPAVLVNALYFYGSWRVPFERDATRPADFHTLAGDTLQVDTMFSSDLSSRYASAEDYSLAELSYVGEHLRMVIVLPAQGKFESVRSAANAAWLNEALSGSAPKLLSVALPKFKLTVGTFSLRAGLEALGMKQAFSDSADFTGIAPALSIADVLQKCFIAIDEDGTEAAAATAVVFTPTSAPVEAPIPFVVDRPFLFFLRDDSGAILFSGHVVDPSQ